jgi:hypothetical protein
MDAEFFKQFNEFINNLSEVAKKFAQITPEATTG